MAESETTICNKALMALGASTIISLTDKTIEARICHEHYAACRDAVLEDNEWSFAIDTFKLSSPLTQIDSGSKYATVELHGWANAFRMPVDMLRLLSVNRDTEGRQPDPYEVQGRDVYTNCGEIIIRGIMQVTDPSYFSPRFVQALVFYLAANISLPLTESASVMEKMMGRYMHEKTRAQANDGRQGLSRRRRTTIRR